MRWFTSDLHFGHEHVLNECKRPFPNVNRMDQKLISRYNEVVDNNDIVYILGDLALVGPSRKSWLQEKIERLKGRKRLILGNHDTLSAWDYIEMGFEEVHTNYKLKIGEAIVLIVHDPAAITVMPPDTSVLCGHVHDLWANQIFTRNRRALNVGVDVNDFKPISEEYIEKVFSSCDRVDQEP